MAVGFNLLLRPCSSESTYNTTGLCLIFGEYRAFPRMSDHPFIFITTFLKRISSHVPQYPPRPSMQRSRLLLLCLPISRAVLGNTPLLSNSQVLGDWITSRAEPVTRVRWGGNGIAKFWTDYHRVHQINKTNPVTFLPKHFGVFHTASTAMLADKIQKFESV